MGLVYLNAIIVDPVIFAFRFYPLENEHLFAFQRAITFVFLLDFVLETFTGNRKQTILFTTATSKGVGSIDDPSLERDIVKLLKIKMRTAHWIDLLANLPILIY